MVRSLVLFAHVIGVVALSSALILEWVGWRTVWRSDARAEALAAMRITAMLPRVYGVAFAAIIASGGYLGGRLGMLDDGWMRVSYGALLLIALSSGMARARVRQLRAAVADPSDRIFAALRSSANDTALRVSLHARIALALAVVYLMIGKPAIGAAVGVIGLAIVSALLTSLTKSHVTSPAARSSAH